MSTHPDPRTTYERVRTLPAPVEQAVGEDFIDVNGHMNIADYFRLGSWAPWLRLGELGVDEDYISGRQLSFFTVEHQIRYLSELRLGERFAVHTGLVARTAKALHAVAAVADLEHERVACVMEIVYVHVSTTTRRSTAIPDDVADALDREIAGPGSGWLPGWADRLTLRPPT